MRESHVAVARVRGTSRVRCCACRRADRGRAPVYDLNDNCADAQPVTNGITPYATLRTTTDDPDRACGVQSTVELEVEAGVEYLIRVGDWTDGHCGYGLLSIELLSP
jgi:hypothetical protein